jgi:hypothetical protein
MLQSLNTNDRIAGLTMCHQFGHAPPEAEFIAPLNKTRITCTRCRKSVYEPGNMTCPGDKGYGEKSTAIS